jgi:hypothetical protein
MSCGVESCGCSIVRGTTVHLDFPSRKVFTYAREGTRPIAFITQSGKTNACDAKSGDTIFTGCNYIYHTYADSMAQCGHAEALTFYTEIPDSRPNSIKAITDADCLGAAKTYVQPAGKKYACFYKDDDESEIRKVFNQKVGNTEMSTLFNTLKEDFCKLSKNVFKNPGGGSCLEYDTVKSLAKEYCSVGDRIATDASCTSANLGNFYAGIAETYCRTAVGKADPWCACYNVTNNVCDTDSAAAGCDKKRQQFDKLVEATPEGFRNVWSGKAACFGGVCQGDKYVPQNANQNCNAPIQICAQSFDLNQISESTIEAQCNLTATTTTVPSAGGTPSGTPPTTPPTTPSGNTPDNPRQHLREHLRQHLRQHLREHLRQHLRQHLREHLPEHLPEHLRVVLVIIFPDPSTTSKTTLRNN